MTEEVMAALFKYESGELETYEEKIKLISALIKLDELWAIKGLPGIMACQEIMAREGKVISVQ